LAGSSGKPVERILPTFVNQPGVPLIEVALACTGGKTSVTLTQQRFLMNATQHETGRWQIPVCVKAPGQAAPTCDVLTEPSQTLALSGGCGSWVFANAGAHGYYRTAYSSDALPAAAPHAEPDPSAPDRLSLAAEGGGLVAAGGAGSGAPLTLAP